MNEQFFIRGQGWCVAPHGIGHFQESMYDDVLASRYNFGMRHSYVIFVCNLQSINDLENVIPTRSRNIEVWNVAGQPTNHGMVAEILQKYNLKSPQFAEFNELPIVSSLQCFEDGCQKNAQFWVTNAIDGYTDCKIAVCKKHACIWEKDFDGMGGPKKEILKNEFGKRVAQV